MNRVLKVEYILYSFDNDNTIFAGAAAGRGAGGEGTVGREGRGPGEQDQADHQGQRQVQNTDAENFGSKVYVECWS